MQLSSTTAFNLFIIFDLFNPFGVGMTRLSTTQI